MGRCWGKRDNTSDDNNKPLGRASVRVAAERIPAPRVHHRFLVPRILGIPSWVALLPISRRGLALTAQGPWDQPLTAARNPQPLDSPPPESPDAGQLPPEPSAQSADFRGLEELPLPSPQARFHPRTLWDPGAWEREPAQAPSFGVGWGRGFRKSDAGATGPGTSVWFHCLRN